MTHYPYHNILLIHHLHARKNTAKSILQSLDRSESYGIIVSIVEFAEKISRSFFALFEPSDSPLSPFVVSSDSCLLSRRSCREAWKQQCLLGVIQCNPWFDIPSFPCPVFVRGLLSESAPPLGGVAVLIDRLNKEIQIWLRRTSMLP